MTVSFLGHLTSSPKILKKKQCVHYRIIGIPHIPETPETMVLSAQFGLIRNTPQGQSGDCNRDYLNYYNHT